MQVKFYLSTQCSTREDKALYIKHREGKLNSYTL
jgi:hypothetical protein